MRKWQKFAKSFWRPTFLAHRLGQKRRSTTWFWQPMRFSNKETYKNGSGIENHALKGAMFDVATVVGDMNFPFASLFGLKWGVKGPIFFTHWASQRSGCGWISRHLKQNGKMKQNHWCKNVGRLHDFSIFWHLLTWIQVLFQTNSVYEVYWVGKRLNSCEKTSKSWEITSSADVFTTNQTSTDNMIYQIFDIFSNECSLFSTQLSL